jgi:hypothetical protein
MAASRPNETIDHVRVPYPIGSNRSPSSTSDLKAEMELINESHRCFQTLSCCSRARLRAAPRHPIRSVLGAIVSRLVSDVEPCHWKLFARQWRWQLRPRDPSASAKPIRSIAGDLQPVTRHDASLMPASASWLKGPDGLRDCMSKLTIDISK